MAEPDPAVPTWVKFPLLFGTELKHVVLGPFKDRAIAEKLTAVLKTGHPDGGPVQARVIDGASSGEANEVAVDVLRVRQ